MLINESRKEWNGYQIRIDSWISLLIFFLSFPIKLGRAPHWCAFLDSLTEELEEQSENVVYDDYKFVTREEIASLGLNHLIGTNMLRVSDTREKEEIYF